MVGLPLGQVNKSTYEPIDVRAFLPGLVINVPHGLDDAACRSHRDTDGSRVPRLTYRVLQADELPARAESFGA